MNSFALAKIVLIEDSDNGYTKLILANPVPWKTRYLSFCVWNKKKLLTQSDLSYGLCDIVMVEYKQPGRFLKLVSLSPVKVIACVVCLSFQEVQFDQQQLDQKRFNCNTCSLYDEGRRARLDGELVLIANNEKECTYSKGRCLTFVNEMTDELYFSWSFPNKPYFKVLSVLETKKVYRVKGWINKHTDDGNFVVELTDVPDLI